MYPCPTPTTCTCQSPAEQLPALHNSFADIVATQPPKHVLEPHGSNAFALGDGAAYQPEKRLSVYDEKILEAARPSIVDGQKYPQPSDEERRTLRKVADSIPAVSYWLCAVEFAERASYYGVQTVFSNFIEYPLPTGIIQSHSHTTEYLQLITCGRWQWCRGSSTRHTTDGWSSWPRGGVR